MASRQHAKHAVSCRMLSTVRCMSSDPAAPSLLVRIHEFQTGPLLFSYDYRNAHLISWAVEFVFAHDHQPAPVCILVDPGALSNVTPGEAAIKRQPGARPGKHTTTAPCVFTQCSIQSCFYCSHGFSVYRFSLITSDVSGVLGSDS